MARRWVGKEEARAPANAPANVPASAPATPLSDTRPGWSFYEAADTCWRYFFHRYVEPQSAPVTPPHLLIGTAYHALHEGKGEELKKNGQLAPHMVEAARLYTARLKRGPPLPPALAREQTVGCKGALEGIFFSTPDVVEAQGVRDFKTAARLYGDEREKWAVSGEIIGELVATGAEKATVDVVTKEKTPRFGLFEVRLTGKKQEGFERLILNLLVDMRRRYERAQESVDAGKQDPVLWPTSFSSCYRYGKPCSFLNLCWGDGFGFEKRSKVPWVAKLLGGGRVKLSRGLRDFAQ